MDEKRKEHKSSILWLVEDMSLSDINLEIQLRICWPYNTCKLIDLIVFIDNNATQKPMQNKLT